MLFRSLRKPLTKLTGKRTLVFHSVSPFSAFLLLHIQYSKMEGDGGIQGEMPSFSRHVYEKPYFRRRGKYDGTVNLRAVDICLQILYNGLDPV